MHTYIQLYYSCLKNQSSQSFNHSAAHVKIVSITNSKVHVICIAILCTSCG